MPYHPNTPQVNEDPSDSQPLFLDNFSSINTNFAINHIPFTAGVNNGQHTKVFFPLPLVADPNLIAPVCSLYTKDSTSFAVTTPELFFQNGALASNVKQLTNIPLVTTTPGATGYGFKSPWGLTFNFGFILTPIVDPVTVIFQVPFGGAVFFAAPTLLNPTTFVGAPYISAINTAQMTITGFTVPTTSLYFIAIGQS